MTPSHIQNILDRLLGAKRSGRGWQAYCPVHENDGGKHRRSLSINIGNDGRVLVHCHAGCPTPDILRAIGLSQRDLFPSSDGEKPKPVAEVVAAYDYLDANGALAYQVLRYSGKKFAQRRPDPERSGRWIWNMKDTPRVLFNLPAIAAVPEDETVFVVEGEKDANSLAAIGLTVTCNSGGAMKWKTLANDSVLAGRRVAIIADKDEAGRRHAQDVASRLAGKAAEIKIIEMPGESNKDASDWLESLDSKEPAELVRALAEMAEAAPVWRLDEASWPEMLELKESAGEPPRFPVECLPEWLKSMVLAVSTATQTPPELAGSIALGVLALCGAGKMEIEPSPGWHEPANLFVAVALPPGCRKSAVFRTMCDPLTRWERREREQLGPQIARAKTEREILERKLRKMKKDAADDDIVAQEKACNLSIQLAAMTAPTFPRLFASDATPEAISRLLAEQQGRLGVFSAEGGELTAIIAGRYSRNGESNMEVFLKGHAGDPIRIDRANRDREPIMLDHPALTVALCLQPSVLEMAWEHREFGDRGLLARFLYVIPRNPLGNRNVDPPPLPKDVAEEYADIVLRLLDLPREEDEQGSPPRVTLTERARLIFSDFEAQLEPQLATHGRYGHMTGWAGKLAGAIAKIAGALHIAANTYETAPWQQPIDADTMTAALALGEFFATHAERAYRMFGATPETRTAGRVLKWIEEGCLAIFSERDLYRSLGLRKAEATEALALLEETGHVRTTADAESAGRPGRKPSRMWEVNPSFGEKHSIRKHNFRSKTA